jgi:hypothetical protein
MTFAQGIAVLIVLVPGLALAAPKDDASGEAAKPKDCQTIKSITVRQACLDRQAAEHPEQTQSKNMSDAVDDLKREDDLLSKKLKSICRGC